MGDIGQVSRPLDTAMVFNKTLQIATPSRSEDKGQLLAPAFEGDIRFHRHLTNGYNLNDQE